ncbi:MAG: Gx transporter family protein [Clostridia bacterium]
MRDKRFYIHKLSALAVMLAMSLIMFVVENFLPPLFIVGAKLGLSNIFSLFSLVIWGPWEAIAITVARAILGNLIVGNLSSMIYSLTAGVVSICASSLVFCLCYRKVSLVAVSVLSATLHNLVQNLIFCLLTDNLNMLLLSPYLALLGILAGLVVGLVTFWLVRAIPTSVYKSALPQQKVAKADA